MCLFAIPLAILRAIAEAFILTIASIFYFVTAGIGSLLAFAFIGLICWGIMALVGVW